MLRIFNNNELPKRLRELRKMALFTDLTRREVKTVDGFLHERNYLAGEVIFDEGETGEAFYVVLEGKVDIFRERAPEKPIATLETGSFFGEMALLDDAPRSAQARAAESCTLVVLFRGDFMKLMLSHALIASKIALRLARHLASRVRDMSRGDLGPM